jgi:hypothetical protein
LRDIVIWKKDRTLPWTHEGTTKKIFEYILVFAKRGANFRYDADNFRESIELKRWWVQYPERYNPKGKALEEIWNFDIPTQGSWGPVHLSHFCPLPAGLVSRIIKLTTRKSDVVLDPFAGTGTVPAQAAISGRRFLGFELNKQYIKMFRAYIKGSHFRSPAGLVTTDAQHRMFEENILHLRILKFARLLYLGTAETGVDYGVERVIVWPLDREASAKNKIYVAQYALVLAHTTRIRELKEKLEALVGAKPLSKFGIEAEIGYIQKPKSLDGFQPNQTVYGYTKTNSHAYAQRMSVAEALASRFPIISTIGKLLEVPDD